VVADQILCTRLPQNPGYITCCNFPDDPKYPSSCIKCKNTTPTQTCLSKPITEGVIDDTTVGDES
jgi:hypothetical protein